MTNRDRLIQVATPQSLQRREIPDADEILLDEVHIWFSKLYPKLLSDPRFADVPIIGLTATPWSKGLGKHFERLIIVIYLPVGLFLIPDNRTKVVFTVRVVVWGKRVEILHSLQ